MSADGSGERSLSAPRLDAFSAVWAPRGNSREIDDEDVVGVLVHVAAVIQQLGAIRRPTRIDVVLVIVGDPL
ncbi:MAG: hypothetical protein ACRDH0_09755, partial [Actinomycetota bacterium]